MITCKQTAIVICTALTFLIASQLMAGDVPGIGKHYLVELDEASLAVNDTTEVARDLSKLYGGHPETSGIPGFHGFAMSMNPERAQLLAKDPRVKSIREAPVPASPRKILAEDVVLLPTITVGPFKYDGAGNIIHMGDDRYTYDEMSRITSGTAATSQNTATQQFEYDGFGNLKKETDPGKTLFIDTDSTTNRLNDTSGSETGTNYIHIWGGAYDAAGNQLAESATVAYAYDSMNMMSERTWPNHEMYLYDADDERVATVIYSNAQSSTWRYTLRDESNHVLRTLTDLIVGGAHSWQQAEDYVYGPAGLLAAITPQGSAESRKHFHHDHLGSAVLITDDNGQRIASHKYWPFGADAPGSDNDGERMKFTGHERDVSGVYGNGLDYMHARYYSPTAGRFLSVDPVLGKPEQPQSWNRYAYVMNNPINRTDPTGLADQCPPPYKCAAAPPPPKPAIPVVLPIKAALAGIKPPPNVPVMKSASTPGAPSSKTMTFAVTAGVSAVVVGGGSASVSLLKSTEIGTAHDGVAATGSVNSPGLGINVGPYVTVGVYHGDVADQRGTTKDINWGFGTVTGTLSWTPSGSFAGLSVGWGPTPTRVGFTTSESGTSVVTSRDVQEKLGIEP